MVRRSFGSLHGVQVLPIALVRNADSSLLILTPHPMRSKIIDSRIIGCILIYNSYETAYYYTVIRAMDQGSQFSRCVLPQKIPLINISPIGPVELVNPIITGYLFLAPFPRIFKIELLAAFSGY